MTPDNIKEALSYISPDLPRDEWVKIAMAVKDGMNGDGYDVFDEWSQGGESYNKSDTADVWRSIKADGGVTVGTLYYTAKQNGWNGTITPESEAERAERDRQRAATAKKKAEEKMGKEKRAAAKANALWKAASPIDTHPYLARKGVKPCDALRAIGADAAAKILGYRPKCDGEQLAGVLLVALVEIDGKISTAEMIDEAGRKSAIAGGRKNGGFWSAQDLPDTDGAGEVIMIGEGIATVLSAKAATDYLAIATLNAEFFEAVATTIRARYPAANIIILGERGPAYSKAEAAAWAAGAAICAPEYPSLPNTADFNDLHNTAGIDIVRRQINAAKKFSGPENNNQEGKNFSENEKNPTLPTPIEKKNGKTKSSDIEILHQNLHQSYTKPANPTPKPTPQVRSGAFVFIGDDGKPHRTIESKAAKILAKLLSAERYAWDPDAASWHRFDGSCWAPLPSSAEPERVVLRALFEGCEPVGFKQSYFNGVLSIMLRAGLIPLPPVPDGKIPFRNGLLDIMTRKIEPITPETAATWAIPHDYHNSAKCPAFVAWLRSATDNDAGLIEVLRAFINACLTGRADLQKFLHLLGPGGTGKSTFIRLMFAILGPGNCVTTDLLHLEQNRFETAMLYGKRLTAITDSDRYGGSVNVLKAITGQDPIRNERKHVQQSGTFTYTGMVLIASNEPLASTDYTSGLDRRRLVVKFDRRIPAEEKAVFLTSGGEDRLHAEIPAIINWALELSPDAVTRAFMHPPLSAVQAGLESLTAQNPIAEWITETLYPAPGNWVLIGVRVESRTIGGMTVYEDADTRLYPSYLKWCAENRREPLALRRFRHAAVDMLRTLGADVVESRRGPGQGVTGVRFKVDFEEPYPWLVQDENARNLHQCSVGVGSEKNPTPPEATVHAASGDFSGSGVGFSALTQKKYSVHENREWDYQNGRWTDDPKIDEETLRWLTNCPASDGNFISHLKSADVETLREAAKCERLTKTARTKIESRIRALERNAKS